MQDCMTNKDVERHIEAYININPDSCSMLSSVVLNTFTLKIFRETFKIINEVCISCITDGFSESIMYSINYVAYLGLAIL